MRFESFVVLLLCFSQAVAWRQSLFGGRICQKISKKVAILSTVGLLTAPLGAFAIDVQYKLPPIDLSDKNRCVLVSSSMGQANAARDKLYDLRKVCGL